MGDSSTYDINSENAMSGELNIMIANSWNLNKQGNIGYALSLLYNR